MLGVFLLGIFTKSRGSDRGNLVALVAGLLSTSVLGDLPGKMNPSWSLNLGWQVSFTWFAFIGATTVLVVGVWFKTPKEALALAERRVQSAESPDDRPVALRDS